MTRFIPPGFNADKVTAGLTKAMQFGASSTPVAFYVETIADLPASTPADQSGLPFDPAKKRPKSVRKLDDVDCAVEYFDNAGVAMQFGDIQPTKLQITILGEQYERVKGFSFVVAGGDKYYYSKTQPPIGLASIDVYTLHCTAQDER